MYSASDLISALLERPRSRLWFRAGNARPAGEFPPGWRAWFATMRERMDAVRGATAESFIAIFLGRELARPGPRSPLLNDWQAFAALWRQQWQPADEGERRQRIVALAVTLVVHIVFFILLLWLAYVRFSAPPPAGEEVVQVEFIGEGTPDSPGGGAKESAAPSQAKPATRPSANPASNPAPAAAQPPAPAASAATSEQPPAQTPAETMPLPDQPLVVTETPLPDPRFALPPTTPPELRPTIAPPRIEVPLQSRQVPLAEQPEPLPSVATPQLQTTEAPTPVLRADTPALSAREIPMPQAMPQVSAPALQATKPTAAPTLQAQAALQSREVPLQPGTATTPAPGAAPSAASSSAPSAPGNNAKPQPSSGTLANPATPGSGPSTAARPGAWPTPKRGDDWGDSNRNRPGGIAGSKDGLFKSDGTPRLPPGSSSAPGGGYPPGSDTWTREAIDRNGTWLKRPPNNYTPTMFDQYWMPRETLLEEWVRKGIKQTEIGIPGTSKKIHCVISILQLGGGCYVTDPNLNDQEATARPPPDIPWKPELQEDQDSLKKPPQP
ncbi:MAG TPA: hypothetical protein VFI26_05580 [Lysobacter sp.]|nr:hypothetical protein [Lysobacter sp.]